MTREQAKELLPIIQAFAEGKTIEKYDILLGWSEVDNPTFNSIPENYRIKQESNYRPFKTQEECWNEMLKHQPFGWLKGIEDKREVVHIGRVFEVKGITLITLSINEGINNNSSYFFNEYTFDDGTPFGIKEE